MDHQLGFFMMAVFWKDLLLVPDARWAAGASWEAGAECSWVHSSPLALLCIVSNPLLFQHWANTVCRPTMHTQTHKQTHLWLFPSLSSSLRNHEVPVVGTKRHPAGWWRQHNFTDVTFSLNLQVPAGTGGAGGQQGGPGGWEGGVSQRGPGAGWGLGLPLHGDVSQEQDHGGWAFRGDRQADGLLPSAGPERGLLPRL